MKKSKLQIILVGIAALGLANVARADSFTVTVPASIPVSPADILIDLGPIVAVPSPVLGLTPADIIDAISDGLDPVPFGPHTDFFSVTPGSVGAPGSGVAAEVAADTPPGGTPGHAADIFVSSPALVGTNILAPAPFGWTLGTATGDEANAGLASPGDNVNSYDLAFAPPPGPMGPVAPIFFSLAAGSPSLMPGGPFGPMGATPGDILAVGGPFGPAPVVFLPGAVLGLPPGADLDALALFVPPGAPFLGPGTIEYSLTAGTAGLVPASLGSGAAVLGLALAGGPVLVHAPGDLGLLPGDDLDALDLDSIIVPEPASWSLLGFGALALILLRQRSQA